MKHKNPDCTNIDLGGGNCPKCNSPETAREAVTHNHLLAYEIIALMFYNDTGLMAPGKSVSPVMMDSRYEDGTRETAWQKWQELNKAHIKAVMEIL